MRIKNLFILFLITTLFLFCSVTVFAEEETEAPAPQNENNSIIDSSTGALTGVGLVAIGGAGSFIIARNMQKPKDQPSSEIKASERDDLDHYNT